MVQGIINVLAVHSAPLSDFFPEGMTAAKERTEVLAHWETGAHRLSQEYGQA